MNIIKFEGFIYKRTLISPSSKKTGDYKKSYIGKTDNIDERNVSWNKPNSKSYGGKKINEARKKYGVGKDSWDFEILEKVCADTEPELKEKLKEKETEYIKKYDSVKKGFNGSYGDGMKGMNHSDASKKKISANHRHYQSEDAKKKISKSNQGRVVSEDAKRRISEANKDKKRTDEHCRKLSESRKGKEPVAASKGLKEYIERNGHGPTKGIKQSDEARDNMKIAQQKRGTKVRAIYPDGSTKDYNTMLDAAKACSMNVGSVASVIKTDGTCRNGMRFEKVT